MQADHVAFGIPRQGDVTVLADSELGLHDLATGFGGAGGLDGAIGATDVDDDTVASGIQAWHPSQGAAGTVAGRLHGEGPRLDGAFQPGGETRPASW